MSELGSGLLTSIISAIIAGLILLWLEHRSGLFVIREKSTRAANSFSGSQLIQRAAVPNAAGVRSHSRVESALFGIILCSLSVIAYVFASSLLAEYVIYFKSHLYRNSILYVVLMIMIGVLIYGVAIAGVVWLSYRDTNAVSRVISLLLICISSIFIIFIMIADSFEKGIYEIFVCICVSIPVIIRMFNLISHNIH